MPNGKPGDHPITDIMVWNLEVYGTELDSLVREVWTLFGEVGELNDKTRELGESVGQASFLELLFAAEDDPARRPRLRDELLAVRDQLRAEAAG
jgi:hypothetical protein